MAAEAIGKSVLIDKIAEKIDVSKKDIKTVIDAFTQTTIEEVGKGAEIRLIGFGTFKKNSRAARKGHNPQTGEPIDIPASESLGFRSNVKY